MAFLTEEEARTKWCFRSDPNTVSTACVARECMAWRWAEEFIEGEGLVTAYKKTPKKDAPGHFINEPIGFCGLAGKP